MKKLLAAWRTKDLIVFDLDGTLAESKSAMDKEMAGLMRQLLNQMKVAVISGGKYLQFEKQILSKIEGEYARLDNLFLFPTTSNSFYRYDVKKKAWKRVYAHFLSAAQKKAIVKALEKTFAEVGYEHPKKIYGTLIEDRETQLTFSALGQDVVDVLGAKGIRLKEEWAATDPRPKMLKVLAKYLPKGVEAKSGGITSIDIVQKGIDKAYGIRQIEKHVKISRKKMLFIGDRIFPGGNDYAVVKTGVEHLQVAGPEETKKAITFLLN
jgi:phosphomannomutase